MKTKLLLYSNLLFCCQIFAQEIKLQHNINTPHHSAGKTNHIQAKNAVLFYEDFENGLNGNNGFGAWTTESISNENINYGKPTPVWSHDFDGSNGYWNNGDEPIETASTQNAFMILDLDLWHTPFNASNMHRLGASLTSPIIN